MRVLLIGGNGFIGRFLADELVRQNHAVALFHRGTTAAPAGVEVIRGDRNHLSASALELKRFAPDVVIDMVLSSGSQAEELVNLFRGATRRVVMLSSMDVYRAVGVANGTESGPPQEVPLTEDSELRQRLHPYPPESLKVMRQIFPWVTDDYDKIPAERVVMSDGDLPGTILRLPMAYGPGDPLRRFYPVVKRIADGTTPPHYCRHPGSLALAARICREPCRSHCARRYRRPRRVPHLQRVRGTIIQRAGMGAEDRCRDGLGRRLCRFAR